MNITMKRYVCRYFLHGSGAYNVKLNKTEFVKRYLFSIENEAPNIFFTSQTHNLQFNKIEVKMAEEGSVSEITFLSARLSRGIS